MSMNNSLSVITGDGNGTLPIVASNFTLQMDDVDDEEDEAIMGNSLVKMFFLVAYVAVFFSCLIGNCMVLIVIIANRSMRTITNFFLGNLAIADLLVGIFCVCQNAAHFVLFEHGSWLFGKTLCHAYIYILHMIPNASAGILVLLSVERFIAVQKPMAVHHFMTKSVLIVCAFAVWAMAALMNVPYLIAVQHMQLQNALTGETYGICTRRFLLMAEINVLKVVTVVNLIVWYILPLSMLLLIYISIGFVLMQSNQEDYHRRQSWANINRTASNTSSIVLNRHNSSQHRLKKNGVSKSGGNSNNRKMSESGPKIEVIDSRKRVIRLVVGIVFAFAFLSAPRYMYLTWSVFRDTNSPRCLNCLSALIQPTTFLLMFINSGLNPILYAFLSQRFRCAIRETFTLSRRKDKSKSLMLMLYNHRRSQCDAELQRHRILGHSVNSAVTTHSAIDLQGGGEENGNDDTDSLIIETVS